MKYLIVMFVLSVLRKVLVVAFIATLPMHVSLNQTACSPPGEPIGGSGHHCRF